MKKWQAQRKNACNFNDDERVICTGTPYLCGIDVYTYTNGAIPYGCPPRQRCRFGVPQKSHTL